MIELICIACCKRDKIKFASQKDIFLIDLIIFLLELRSSFQIYPGHIDMDHFARENSQLGIVRNCKKNLASLNECSLINKALLI